jgi:hypothetical protein
VSDTTTDAVKRYIVNGTFIDDYSHTQAKVPMVMASDYDAIKAKLDRYRKCEQHPASAMEWIAEMQASQAALKAENERLERERNEWATKWLALRAELAEIKYPGMKGVIKALGEDDYKERHAKVTGLTMDAALAVKP